MHEEYVTSSKNIVERILRLTLKLLLKSDNRHGKWNGAHIDAISDRARDSRPYSDRSVLMSVKMSEKNRNGQFRESGGDDAQFRGIESSSTIITGLTLNMPNHTKETSIPVNIFDIIVDLFFFLLTLLLFGILPCSSFFQRRSSIFLPPYLKFRSEGDFPE